MNDCKKAAVPKDLLKNLVIDTTIKELSKPQIMDGIVSNLLALQERKSKANTALSGLLKEQKQIENSLKNIVSAIEQGVVSNTTKKRLQELEARQQEIEKLILIEKSKTAVTITEKEIREFYAQALRGDPQMLVNYLIKEIVLYDDKIEIYYNSPIKISPDDSQGFSFCHKTIIFYNVITQLKLLIK